MTPRRKRAGMEEMQWPDKARSPPGAEEGRCPAPGHSRAGGTGLPLLEAGAKGYITKEAASRDLVGAIRVVATGEVYVRPAAARLLAAAVIPEHAAMSARSRFHILSDREQTILRLVAQGYSGAEIARQLSISTKTVDAYKRRVQEKLGLEHRTDYVRFAIEAGILG